MDGKGEREEELWKDRGEREEELRKDRSQGKKYYRRVVGEGRNNYGQTRKERKNYGKDRNPGKIMFEKEGVKGWEEVVTEQTARQTDWSRDAVSSNRHSE